MGGRPASEDNSVHAKGYLVIDGGISFVQSGYRISLSGENLLNTLWNEAQFDTESRLAGEPAPVSELHFTPGTPRTIRVTLALTL